MRHSGRLALASTVVFTGAGPFSLGETLVHALSSAAPEKHLLVLDVQGPRDPPPSAVTHRFDLNPFHHASDYASWSRELETAMRGRAGTASEIA